VSRRRAELGQAGGIEILPFGVLVFVGLSLLLTNAWGVVDAKFATDAAAREATRAFVESRVDDSSQYTDALSAAVEAGKRAIASHGRDPNRATIALIGRPGEGFRRCARVTFAVSYLVPALRVPYIGGFGTGIEVRSRHSEVIDPYRSGVPGDAAC
jgi:hypothetical protein